MHVHIGHRAHLMGWGRSACQWASHTEATVGGLGPFDGRGDNVPV